MPTWISHEPAIWGTVIGGLIAGILSAAITLGAPIPPDTAKVVGPLVGTIVTVIAGLIIRSKVTPVAKLAAPTPVP